MQIKSRITTKWNLNIIINLTIKYLSALKDRFILGSVLNQLDRQKKINNIEENMRMVTEITTIILVNSESVPSSESDFEVEVV